jgi:hypothetical protein
MTTVQPLPIEDDDVDYDFDAEWAARGAVGPRVRIRKRVYQLPASPPAKLILWAANNNRASKKKTNLAEVVDLLGSLLGKDNVDQVLADGLEIDQLGDVIRFCMGRLKEWRAGEAEAPEAGATGSTPSA